MLKSHHIRSLVGAIAIALLAAMTERVAAEDTYYTTRIGDLIDVAKVTGDEVERTYIPYYWQDRETMFPYIALDGPGEAFVARPETPANQWEQLLSAHIVGIRAPEGADVTGRIFVPRSDARGMVAVDFTIPAADGDAAHRQEFLDARLAHYLRLQGRDLAGGAWFRHQVRLTRQARGADVGDEAEPPPAPNRWAAPGEMERTFALLSGGRALSENLQLDRILPTAEAGAKTIDVETIDGITVRAFDWAPLVEGLEPETDPMAALVPDDQHALFFPTFSALIDMADHADAQGTPVLRAMEPRAEDAQVRQRYERQLCLPLNEMARQLGPRLVKSVAITGSDPYLRTGSDVAVLFEATNPTGLKTVIAASAALLSQGDPLASPVSGDVNGVPYSGMRTPDRSICCYIAQLNDAIVVTNSLAQLERLVAVFNGDAPSLASLDEYTFFRDRYRRGEGDETALLVLSDDTIRRWCGPRWRIGTSRRTRAVAVMAEIQAAYLDKLADGTVEGGPVHTAHPLPENDELRLAPGGVVSSVYGDLTFQTPIAELDLDRVTREEADIYAIWRDRYQYRWRNFFDPIAVQFRAGPQRLAVDVTVMPLIEGTDYGQVRGISGNAAIAPDAGDLHENTIMHWAMAIDRESPMVQMYGGMAAGMAPQLKVDPLGWFGGSVALYADESPFWDELAAADDPEDFIEPNMHRLPVALHAEVGSGMKLTAFLAGARAFIDQTAPGMTVWENLTHNDVPYVRITPSEMARSDEESIENLTLCYAASGEALIISLNEDTLKRALDRQIARRAAKAEGDPVPAPARPWLGESLCLQVAEDVLPLIEAVYSENYQRTMQYSAWNNLAILNEWKRLHPEHDPVQFQEEFWQRRLICPGGGAYRWNEQWSTMESTVYGHPGEPKDGPPLPGALMDVLSLNAGLTFEEHGLRAAIELERQAPEP